MKRETNALQIPREYAIEMWHHRSTVKCAYKQFIAVYAGSVYFLFGQPEICFGTRSATYDNKLINFNVNCK